MANSITYGSMLNPGNDLLSQGWLSAVRAAQAQREALANGPGFAQRLQAQLRSNGVVPGGAMLDLGTYPYGEGTIGKPVKDNVSLVYDKQPPLAEDGTEGGPSYDLAGTVKGALGSAGDAYNNAVRPGGAMDNWFRTAPVGQALATVAPYTNVWEGAKWLAKPFMPQTPTAAPTPEVAPTPSFDASKISALNTGEGMVIPQGGNASAKPPASPWEAMLRGLPQGAPRAAFDLPAAPTLQRPNVEYPTTPVPQMAQPTPFDRTNVDKWLDAAKPPEYKADMKEASLAGLLGLASGLANAKPGANLGQTFAAMVGSGAPAFMQGRQAEKQRERESEREGRAYAGARANTEIGLENSRLAREDKGKEIDYTNAQALRQDLTNKNLFNIEVAKLNNMVDQGNWTMAVDRLEKIRQAGVQDEQLDILRQRANAAMIAAGLRGQAGANGMSHGALNPTGSEIVKQSLIQPYMGTALQTLRQDKTFQLTEKTKPEEAARQVEGLAMYHAFSQASGPQKQMILQMLQAQKNNIYSQMPGGLEF